MLDFIMQGLWLRTQSSPLESQYFSCVPYLLGDGQAMVYSFWSRLKTRTRVPRLPLRPPDNYLRDAMIATLARQDVEFDLKVQVQTDPFRMPIENNAVYWRQTFTASTCRGPAHSQTEIRFSRANRISQHFVFQSLALHSRAPPVG